MSYVTSIGATPRVVTTTISPAAMATMSRSTTSTAPTKTTTTPSASQLLAMATRPTAPRPTVKPPTSTPVVFTGAGIAEAPNHTPIIVGAALGVGLLLVLALRR